MPATQILSEVDQEENARKEAATKRIMSMTGAEREDAVARENARKEEYKNYRALIVKATESIKAARNVTTSDIGQGPL